MEATVYYLFICKFKAKYPEIKDYTLCLSNILKDFTINNIYTYIYILDIHRNLSKGKVYMIMLGVITKMFIVLLSKIVSGSNHTKCTSLCNQKYILSWIYSY